MITICSLKRPPSLFCFLQRLRPSNRNVRAHSLNRRRAWPGPHMQGPGEGFARRRAAQQPSVPVRVLACVVEA